MSKKIPPQGFTLFEVMIAMAIMSSAAILLANAWSGNQMRIKKMTINNRAAFLLDQAVSEIEIEFGKKYDQVPDSDGGAFEKYPGFSWEMTSQKFEMPDLRSMLVSGGQGSEIMLLMIDKLSEYFNESIKEVLVTVKYTAGKRSVKYSATTFIVNYDKPIPLPGMGGGNSAGGQ